MDESLRKAIRNALWVYAIMVFCSFVFGGIFHEMLIEKTASLTIGNLGLALLGAVIMAIPLGFMPVFVGTLIFFYFKKK